jgi:Ca2+-binding RTX toxin-like protein
MLVGVALISVSVTDAPASATVSNERTGVVHGSDETDVLSGGSGDDEIYGGSGRDLLVGGRGSDFIEAKDGEADYVACGAGDDTASIDDDDHAASDCETVYQG